MLKIFEKARARYKAWKDQRFLKRHHCSSWEQYHRAYDPDVWQACGRIKDFYHGYPYVYCIDNVDHYAFQLLYDYGPGGARWGYHVINQWCKENCKDKHRVDVHRVERNLWSREWEMNEISGGDYPFFAFKNERDYVNFILKWS